MRWAQVCMELEDTVGRLDALFEPVFAQRMEKAVAGAVLPVRLCKYRPQPGKKICSSWTVS